MRFIPWGSQLTPPVSILVIALLRPVRERLRFPARKVDAAEQVVAELGIVGSADLGNLGTAGGGVEVVACEEIRVGLEIVTEKEAVHRLVVDHLPCLEHFNGPQRLLPAVHVIYEVVEEISGHIRLEPRQHENLIPLDKILEDAVVARGHPEATGNCGPDLDGVHTKALVADCLKELAQRLVIDARHAKEEIEVAVDLRRGEERNFALEVATPARVFQHVDYVLDVVVVAMLLERDPRQNHRVVILSNFDGKPLALVAPKQTQGAVEADEEDLLVVGESLESSDFAGVRDPTLEVGALPQQFELDRDAQHRLRRPGRLTARGASRLQDLLRVEAVRVLGVRRAPTIRIGRVEQLGDEALGGEHLKSPRNGRDPECGIDVRTHQLLGRLAAVAVAVGIVVLERHLGAQPEFFRCPTADRWKLFKGGDDSPGGCQATRQGVAPLGPIRASGELGHHRVSQRIDHSAPNGSRSAAPLDDDSVMLTKEDKGLFLPEPELALRGPLHVCDQQKALLPVGI